MGYDGRSAVSDVLRELEEVKGLFVEMRDSEEPHTERKADLRWVTKKLDKAAAVLSEVDAWLSCEEGGVCGEHECE